MKMIGPFRMLATDVPVNVIFVTELNFSKITEFCEHGDIVLR